MTIQTYAKCPNVIVYALQCLWANWTNLDTAMDVVEALDVAVGEDGDGDGLADSFDMFPTCNSGQWTFLEEKN